jgi:hypothetical protein
MSKTSENTGLRGFSKLSIVGYVVGLLSPVRGAQAGFGMSFAIVFGASLIF